MNGKCTIAVIGVGDCTASNIGSDLFSGPVTVTIEVKKK